MRFRSSSSSVKFNNRVSVLVAILFGLALILIVLLMGYSFKYIYNSAKHGHKHKINVHAVNDKQQGNFDIIDDLDGNNNKSPANNNDNKNPVVKESNALNSRFDHHRKVAPKELRLEALHNALKRRITVLKINQLRNQGGRQLASEVNKEKNQIEVEEAEMISETQKSLEQAHGQFTRDTSSLSSLQLAGKKSTNNNNNEKVVNHRKHECISSDPAALIGLSRIMFIADDLYSAVESYFHCSFGYDEVRPFSCFGTNWPSEVHFESEEEEESKISTSENTNASSSIASLKQRQAALRQSQRAKSSGLLLTLVDGLTSLILADDAFVNVISKSKQCILSSKENNQEGISTKFTQIESRFTNTKEKMFITNREKDLHATGLFSNVTILSMTAVLEQLEHRWFLFNSRFLSIFELNIRILGSLLSTADLLNTIHFEKTKKQFPIILETATAFQKLALEIGNSFLRSFSHQLMPISSHSGFTQRFFRTADSASSTPSSIYNLAELGTFDLEFEKLSEISGCGRFKQIANDIADYFRSDFLPARSHQIVWRKAIERKNAKMIGNKTGDMSYLTKKNHFDTGLRNSLFKMIHTPEKVALAPETNLFSLGAYGDSFYEYRLKSVLMKSRRNEKKTKAKIVDAKMMKKKKCVNDDDPVSESDDNEFDSDAIQRVKTLLLSIKDLMIDCFHPNRDYFETIDTRNLGEDDREIIENHQRCFISTLKGSIKTRQMSHLACFVGGMFSLAAVTKKKTKNENVGDTNINNDNNSLFSLSEDEVESFLQISRGLALSCSDMSRLTEEGVAGENYKATLSKEDSSPISPSDEKGASANKAGINAEELNSAKYQTMDKRVSELLSEISLDGIELLPDNEDTKQPHLLRPEALEAMYYSSFATQINDEENSSKNHENSKNFASFVKDEAWRMFVSMRRRCRSPRSGGWSSIFHLTRKLDPSSKHEAADMIVLDDNALKNNNNNNNVNNNKNSNTHQRFSELYKDVMPSYFLAETIKYSMFIQVDYNELCHQQPQSQYHSTSSSSIFLDIACSVPKGEKFVMNTEAHPLKI